jgi:hypothetical protein
LKARAVLNLTNVFVRLQIRVSQRITMAILHILLHGQQHLGWLRR